MNEITFYRRFVDDICAGRKTITLRLPAEAAACPVGSSVLAYTHEEHRLFARLQIESVETVHLHELNGQHAEQENMTLPQLIKLIGKIYPDHTEFAAIRFTARAVQAA